MGSMACWASMYAQMPPLRCASATTCMASVDLPDDSGPKISTTRPRGKPPTPRARSSDNAPVWIASMPIVVFSPILMMDPLPNCLSMAANATSSAFSRSLLTVVLRFLPGSVADVEAGLHDLDCVDGHHTEGVLHGSPSGSPTDAERLAMFEQHKCNYEQSFDQVFETASAASNSSGSSGRCTPRSKANQMVQENG